MFLFPICHLHLFIPLLNFVNLHLNFILFSNFCFHFIIFKIPILYSLMVFLKLSYFLFHGHSLSEAIKAVSFLTLSYPYLDLTIFFFCCCFFLDLIIFKGLLSLRFHSPHQKFLFLVLLADLIIIKFKKVSPSLACSKWQDVQQFLPTCGKMAAPSLTLPGTAVSLSFLFLFCEVFIVFFILHRKFLSVRPLEKWPFFRSFRILKQLKLAWPHPIQPSWKPCLDFLF